MNFKCKNCGRESDIVNVTHNCPFCHSQEACKHECWEYLACNPETCDGVKFVHDLHCAECGKAKTQPLKTEWEEEFDNFFVKKFKDGSESWNGVVASQTVKNFIRSLLLAQRDELRGRIEGIREVDSGGNNEHISGYNSAIDDILKML